jgi:hypothetical protein
MSADTPTLTAAICRRLQMFAVGIRRPSTPHPEYYGVPNERVDSADGTNGRSNTPDALESVEATQPWLPIGPSCC